MIHQTLAYVGYSNNLPGSCRPSRSGWGGRPFRRALRSGKLPRNNILISRRIKSFGKSGPNAASNALSAPDLVKNGHSQRLEVGASRGGGIAKESKRAPWIQWPCRLGFWSRTSSFETRDYRQRLGASVFAANGSKIPSGLWGFDRQCFRSPRQLGPGANQTATAMMITWPSRFL